MSVKKKLQTSDVVAAWDFDTTVYKGISIGVYDNDYGDFKSMASIESANTVDGIVKRIVINKTKAEKHGFIIVIDE